MEATIQETGLVLDYKEMPAYKGAKERQEQLLQQYPFVTILDSRTYEVAKQHRTALRQGRYELQNGEKAIASKLNDFRQVVKSETEKLINITLSAETKQQAEIERFEAEKERQKQEELRKERERKEALKAQVFGFRNSKIAAIESSTVKTIEAIISDIETANLQVEEFTEDFLRIKTEMVEVAKRKQSQLIEDERLKAERKAQEEERKRLEAERQKFEAERKAQEEAIKKQREAEEAELQAERDKLEAEKAAIAKAEAERKAKEDAERLAAEQARLKVEREKQEAEEKAKREAEIEAMRPDKEKLTRLIEGFNPSDFARIELSSPKAKVVLGEFINQLDRVKSTMIGCINEL